MWETCKTNQETRTSRIEDQPRRGRGISEEIHRERIRAREEKNNGDAGAGALAEAQEGARDTDRQP